MKSTIWSLVFIFVVALQARAELSVRAASEDAVAGWQRMPTEENKTIWVSPTTGLTASDFQSMTPYVNPGDIWFMKIVLTDDGAKKMRALSMAQMNKLIALVLDGKSSGRQKFEAKSERPAISPAAARTASKWM